MFVYIIYVPAHEKDSENTNISFSGSRQWHRNEDNSVRTGAFPNHSFQNISRRYKGTAIPEFVLKFRR